MSDLDFMDVAAELLSEMRLLVEGAITRYEDDLTALVTPASKKEKPDAHIALSDIGSALYSLRCHITQLQIECYKEAYRQAEQDASNQTSVTDDTKKRLKVGHKTLLSPRFSSTKRK